MRPVRRVPSATLSDEDIVARIRSGERDQFETLIRRHRSRLYRTALAILRDASEAEDVTQNAYMRAYEHLGEFEGRSRFSTWLTRIAMHEAFARVRRGNRCARLQKHTEDLFMATGSSSSPEQETSDAEMRPVLDAAVARLSNDFRSVFVLRAVEGLSGAEVAECLGIPEDTVKTRLHRARERLRRMLAASVESSLPPVSGYSHASETRCRALLESSPLPMWVYDPRTFAFLAVNDAAVRHYGYSRSEFAALTIEDIRPLEDVPALRENVARRTHTGRVWRHRKKDGSIIRVEVKAHDFVFGERRTRRVFANDVTQRLQLEEQLRRSVTIDVIGRASGGGVLPWAPPNSE
jgi:RNA polymerase sigma-70 factor, ECF subfamily